MLVPWKIAEMEVWGPAYIDLVVPGFIEFQDEERHLMGTFQFGTVSGWLDCRLRDVGGEAVVEWSWQGQSDTDPGCGRGWATLVQGERVGRIFIHGGDDSAFRATRQTRPITRRLGRPTQPRAEPGCRHRTRRSRRE
jgi:hypothetical protein